MSVSVADHIVARLSQWGVKRIFGYPGDGIGHGFAVATRMAYDYLDR